MTQQPKGFSEPALSRYGAAIASCVLLLLIKFALHHYVGDTVPFVLFFSAVMFSAWFGGLGPGILATALSASCAALWFMPGHLSFGQRAWPVAVFTIEGVFISLLIGSRSHVRKGMMVEIDQRKEAQGVSSTILQSITDAFSADVARQARVFETTLSTIPDFIYILDRDSRFLYANQALLDLWGLKLEHAVGKDFFELKYPQELAAKLLRQVRQVFDTKKSLSDETPYTSPTGTAGIYEYIFSPVFAADGSVELVVGSTRDVSERKRTEEQLRHSAAEREGILASERAARADAERASRMKDEFLATLSHELRTPLNAILGWSQILSHRDRSEEDITEGLAAIERNARSQTQIIEDLLDMSRIISGKVRFDVQRIELAPLVQSAVETSKPAAEAKGVRLQVMLDPKAGPVSGDPNRLQQIFWNLLNNAVKFTPRGGRVQVLLERVNSHLEISVSDTGEGIKPEFLPHVFDRFRQSDATTTRRHGGLGLGLAIVKQLVELHGGSVTAKSPGEGQGATFTVCLPLTAFHPEPSAPAERRHPKTAPIQEPADPCADITGIKVLVVDDEPDVRFLVKRLLEDCNAIVILASSASEAVDCVRSERPDVIISDIGMPIEDGYSFIRQVRALSANEGGQTPAMALTAYARGEDRVRAIMAGFQHHASKPVEPSELIALVANLAGWSATPIPTPAASAQETIQKA
jgi:PAS domain S-box-containing protein